jgi:hypothetical protein
MVFADTEDIKTDLVGQLDLFKQIAQTLGGRDGNAGFRVLNCCREAVNADLHEVFLPENSCLNRYFDAQSRFSDSNRPTPLLTAQRIDRIDLHRRACGDQRGGQGDEAEQQRDYCEARRIVRPDTE